MKTGYTISLDKPKKRIDIYTNLKKIPIASNNTQTT